MGRIGMRILKEFFHNEAIYLKMTKFSCFHNEDMIKLRPISSEIRNLIKTLFNLYTHVFEHCQ